MHFSIGVFLKSPILISFNYILINLKRQPILYPIFKCYHSELIDESLANWYGPKDLPINIQYIS